MPEPDWYGSASVRVPRFSVSVGVPVTATGSVNETITGITAPARYVPAVAWVSTALTVGAVVSTT